MLPRCAGRRGSRCVQPQPHYLRPELPPGGSGPLRAGLPRARPDLRNGPLPVTVDASAANNLDLQALTYGPSARAAVEVNAIPVSRPGLVDVPISLTGQAVQELDRLGLTSGPVTWPATGGTPTTKTVVIQLIKSSRLSPVSASYRAASRWPVGW